MIVAVEGPTAAGKTTWCRRHTDAEFITEYVPTGAEPVDVDPAALAGFWVGVNADRWRAARELEARRGVAVCDGDPLKLHYSWSLLQIGATTPERFEQDLRATRAAMADDRLGFADLVLLSIPDQATLEAHRRADTERRRSSFDLHSRLAAPLRSWYQAIEALRPGTVVWQHPADGIPQRHGSSARDRSDPQLLDRLVAALPAL